MASHSLSPSRGAAAPDGVPSFRPEIEGLRALAVIMVVIFHIWNQPVGGFVGLDVFFVISGFLITGLLVREYERTGRISIRDFYARRARRILPAAVLVLITCWIVSRLLFFATRAHETFTDILWSAAFAANVHFASIGTDYFNANRAPSPVQHFWSLAVEEQFYVVWPLVLIITIWLARFVFRRRARVAVLVIAFAGFLALLRWSVQLTAANRATAYFSTPARAWELGAGAVLALAASYLYRLPRWLCELAVAAGLVTIFIAAFVTRSDYAFPGPWAIGPVAGAALVIIGGTKAGSSPIAWPLTNIAMRYVGRISFSLYLWHWPILIFLSARLVGPHSYYDAVALLTMAAVAPLSYHFVEEPLRRLKWSSLRRTGTQSSGRSGPRLLSPAWQGRRAAAAVATVMLLCSVAVWMNRPLSAGPVFSATSVDLSALSNGGATAAPATAGSTTSDGGSTTGPAAPAAYGQLTPPATVSTAITAALEATRFPHLNPGLGELNDARAVQWKDCGNVGAKQLDQCTFPATGGPTPAKKVVVIGDSYAISYLPALMDLRSRGYTIYALTYGQCPAAQVTVLQSVGAASGFGTQCDAHREWAVSVVQQVKPDIVVFASLDKTVQRLADGAKGAQAISEWQTGVKTIVSRVQAAGAKRVVTLAAPPEGANLTNCAPSASSDPTNCVVKVADLWRQVTAAERAAAQATKSAYVDPKLLFCSTNEFCPSFIGTAPVRIDDEHLTNAYSQSIGPVLSPPIIGP